MVFHYLNNKLQTAYNPIADQYPKVGTPKIPGMKGFHTNISIKGATKIIIPALTRFCDDFFIGLPLESQMNWSKFLYDLYQGILLVTYKDDH